MLCLIVQLFYICQQTRKFIAALKEFILSPFLLHRLYTLVFLSLLLFHILLSFETPIVAIFKAELSIFHH